MAAAEHSSSPPEIHTLTGSSPPTGASPAFEPVATAVDPPRALDAASTWLDDVGESGFDHLTHPEADLVTACGEAQALVEDYVKAWAAVSDAALGEPAIAATEEGLRLGAQIEAATKRLSASPARTPEGLACKASLMLEIMDADRLLEEGDLTAHSELLRSILEDARWLGTVSRFTLTQLVGLQANPPVRAPAEGWAFRHRMQDWARATLDSERLFERGDDIENLVQRTGIPPALFIHLNDDKLFANLAELRSIDEIKWFGHPATIAMLRDRLDSTPKLLKDATLFETLCRRIQSILNAYDAWPSARHWESAVALYDEGNRRAAEAGKLRAVIERMPAVSLEGLIMKAQIYASEAGSNQQALVMLDAVIEQDGEGGTPMRDVVMRDVLQLLVADGLTIQVLADERELPRDMADPRALDVLKTELDRSAA